MTNKKKNKPSGAAKATSKIQLNATLKPFLLLMLAIIAVTALSIVASGQITRQQVVHKAEQQHLEILSQSIADQLRSRFDMIGAELDTLAEDPYILKVVMQQDDAAFAELATTIQNSFTHSIQARIIPWDYTATVGLKERGIEMHNSIETLMITRAGGGRTPQPELYRTDDHWLISFARPVMLDNEVHAIIFLSLDRNLLASIINKAFIRDHAAVNISQQGQKSAIISNGQPVSGASRTLELPFTGGEVTVASITPVESLYQPALSSIRLVMAASGLVLLAVTLAGLLMLIRSLKTDRLLLVQYTESLSGLHRTQRPALLHKELAAVLDMLNHLGATMRKNAVLPDDPEREKIDHGKTPPPKHLATADVLEDETGESEELAPAFEPGHIFRDYDIRGIANSELTDDNVRLIGRAIASEAAALQITTLLVGRDGRISSQRIFDALSQGISSTGCNVIDIGVVPTPVLYYAAEKSGHGSGIMITASHNPAEYNGMKIMLQGKTLQGPLIERLLKRIQSDNLIEPQTPGDISQQDFTAAYMDDIAGDILVAHPIKVVVDAGNGAGGEIASQLFSRLNCDVTMLFGDIDGNFPNHGPDPGKAENLETLIDTVKQNGAELGLAFDGDADRVVAVTGNGRILYGDQLLMLFARDVVSRNPAATVVYDIKCSSKLKAMVQQYGGRTALSRAGHPHLKDKMAETGALLGGEFSGHYCFKERWNGFDDGIYAALRLIELLTNDNQNLEQQLQELPQSFATPEFVIRTQDDQQKFNIVEKFKQSLSGETGDINTLDGVRIDYPTGWGLLRASNTSAALTARFEADNKETLEQIQNTFRQALTSVADNLKIPF